MRYYKICQNVIPPPKIEPPEIIYLSDPTEKTNESILSVDDQKRIISSESWRKIKDLLLKKDYLFDKTLNGLLDFNIEFSKEIESLLLQNYDYDILLYIAANRKLSYDLQKHILFAGIVSSIRALSGNPCLFPDLQMVIYKKYDKQIDILKELSDNPSLISDLQFIRGWFDSSVLLTESQMELMLKNNEMNTYLSKNIHLSSDIQMKLFWKGKWNSLILENLAKNENLIPELDGLRGLIDRKHPISSSLQKNLLEFDQFYVKSNLSLNETINEETQIALFHSNNLDYLKNLSQNPSLIPAFRTLSGLFDGGYIDPELQESLLDLNMRTIYFLLLTNTSITLKTQLVLIEFLQEENDDYESLKLLHNVALDIDNSEIYAYFSSTDSLRENLKNVLQNKKTIEFCKSVDMKYPKHSIIQKAKFSNISLTCYHGSAHFGRIRNIFESGLMSPRFLGTENHEQRDRALDQVFVTLNRNYAINTYARSIGYLLILEIPIVKFLEFKILLGGLSASDISEKINALHPYKKSFSENWYKYARPYDYYNESNYYNYSSFYGKIPETLTDCVSQLIQIGQTELTVEKFIPSKYIKDVIVLSTNTSIYQELTKKAFNYYSFMKL